MPNHSRPLPSSPPASTSQKPITVSIVSHGQLTLIRPLLGHVAQRHGHITLLGKDASRFKSHEVDRLGV